MFEIDSWERLSDPWNRFRSQSVHTSGLFQVALIIIGVTSIQGNEIAVTIHRVRFTIIIQDSYGSLPWVEDHRWIGRRECHNGRQVLVILNKHIVNDPDLDHLLLYRIGGDREYDGHVNNGEEVPFITTATDGG